jgi:metallophosphoesterase (TIGR00282 family)
VRILFLGEIVDKAGIFTVKALLSKVKAEKGIDFVMANGNGVTGGFGIGRNHSVYLHKLGIDVFTTGECVYYKKDMVPHIAKVPGILRPANYPAGNPGRGWGIYEVAGQKVGVVNMLGVSGFDRTHLNNPFTYIPELVRKIAETTRIIIVNFHARTTAEKKTLAFQVDGHATAMIGTGFRVLTADGAISEKGTFSITDAGRTGSFLSVGGMNVEKEIELNLTQVPDRSRPAWDGLELQGILLDIADTGRCQSYEIIKIPCQEVPGDSDRKGDED